MRPRWPYRAITPTWLYDEETLDSAFRSFRPRDIFIVDNGKTQYLRHPTRSFNAYIKSIHLDAVYIWSPIGNKKAAQFVGALL